ncbi:MAG: ATP phosphoribosyltransferase [Candidatus Lokiarchaeota archaeon]|nr:ATP phosphoribosyltransferase [Candidatus Lokiarchaeota archaeon]
METKKERENSDSQLIRMGIPSKGRMASETQEYLNSCGFKIRRNRQQYIGWLEGYPNIQIVFQRQKDIINGVSNGNLVFGIVGLDILTELTLEDPNKIIIIHDDLGFGKCTLEVSIPESWKEISMNDLKQRNEILRIASKFPLLTKEFFVKHELEFELIKAEGTIEVAPTLGYSDIIVELVSTGQTLKDNRLKRLQDGCILQSQACFIANRKILKLNQSVLDTSRTFLEYFEATIRAKDYVSVFINMRGKDPEDIAKKMFTKESLKGLQGPTISPVVSSEGGSWFAIHIIIEKKKLTETIRALREIGGSGVVVSPTLFIFEEEPKRYKELLKNLEDK